MTHKLLPILTLLSLVITQNVSAKIWRVNNNANATNGSNFGGTVAYPVFQQLFGTAANSASASNLVQAGDTVYLEGSSIVYNGGILTKRLVIIGSGFFLTENPNTSNNMLSSEIGSLYFDPGSEGSQLIAVAVVNNGTVSNINIRTNNIIIKRCKINNKIYMNNNIADILIFQNLFAGPVSSTVKTAIDMDNGSPASNVVINNNIFQKPVLIENSTGTITLLECKNNIFDPEAGITGPSLVFNCAKFENNILKNPAATVTINGGTNLNVNYNTGASAAQFGTSNNNVVVADMTTLFVASGTSDGKYQLKPGSANGSDGTERGAYGGAAVTSRYALSGLAPIPVIYEINTSGVATPTGLDVNIKARTIK